MSASIASYCSGTAGCPKCRSEQWKTVVTCVILGATKDLGGRSESCLKLRDDGVGELVGRCGTAQVARHRLAFLDGVLERATNAARALAVADVVEQHASREHDRARIGDAL